MEYKFENKEMIAGFIPILLKTAHLQLIKNHDLKVAYDYICPYLLFYKKKYRRVMGRGGSYTIYYRGIIW